MFRSICCQVGANLRRTTTTIYGKPSSTADRYILFTYHNPNIVIKPTRVLSSILSSSFSTDRDKVHDLRVNYFIDTCGLPANKANTLAKKVDFYKTDGPDEILRLFEEYGFTKPHITKLISKHPSILCTHHYEELIKPKLEFFKSKGLSGTQLADMIVNDPIVLRLSLKISIIPSYDMFKSILDTDANVIKIFEQLTWIRWILNPVAVERLTVNLELLRFEGVPPSNMFEYVIIKPKAFIRDPDKFKKVVKKVNGMGIDPLNKAYLEAIEVFISMDEAAWSSKTNVYKRQGWSEDQILTAFRTNPLCMKASENKIKEQLSK